MSSSITISIDSSLGDDPDGDGLTTEFELTTSFTDPNNPDTDGDGMEDGYEQWNGFSPLSLELGTSKASYGDFDGDGVTNKSEHDTGRLAKVWNEAYIRNELTDNVLRLFVRSGFITSVEYSTNLANWSVYPRAFVGRNLEETVNLNDWSAVDLSLSTGFFRLRWESVTEDQDGDGMPDLWEAIYNLDVTDDGTTNPELGPDGDIDGDGLSNIEEYEAGTDPTKSDTDSDGITDGGEVGSGTSPLSPLERPGAEWITIVGDGGISEKLTERRRIVVPKGKSRLVVIAGESIEFPCYTGGVGPNCPVDGPSEFNDLMEWKVTPSVGDQFVGTVDVNSVHSDWAIAKEKSFFLNGVGPAAILDARVFTAHGNSDLILDIEVAATNIVDANLETTVFAGILDFAVKDNDFATGVDDMSITAAESDVGFQDKYWIMAPSGGVPANLGGGDAENDTHFAIQIGEDLDLKIEIPPAPPIAPLPPATADPDEFTLNDGVPGPLVVWHGISANSVDVEPVFKMGPAGKEVELPVAVKVMKNRTVKVAVWPVYQNPSRSNSLSEIFATEQSRNEYESELQTLLAEIFAFQMNAWIEVEVKPDQGFDYVNLSSNGTYFAQYDGAKEHLMLSSIKDSSYDINVFLIDGFWYHSHDPANIPDVAADAANGYSYVDGLAPVTRVNCAVVNLNNQTRASSRQTVAHEIGHLMVGEGHPDEYDVSDPNSFGGVAAHQSFGVLEHQKRLMVSGDNITSDSRLLVKSEWDEAEEWLNEFIDNE